MNAQDPSLFENPHPIIGMLHVPPLPGSPRYWGDVQSITLRVLDDLSALKQGGVDGVMLENFGDVPFYPGRVPAITIAHLTAIGRAVRENTDLPIGINMLRNDGQSALAVAHAVGAQFIRVNVLCGARVTDQGILQGIAHDLQRERAQLGAGHIQVWADVNVKHSAPVAPIPLEQEVADLVHRGGADVLIVSGTGTGTTADLAELQAVREAGGGAPVFVGSGVSAANITDYAAHADGFIVGSSLKVDGDVSAAVDAALVGTLVEERDKSRR
jgi:membrane complex biogenesis BtpA family protein